MSETLRDLVVSLSLNSDNFTRNIKSINKQIQEAESEFKLASAGVDGFEKSTAGLSSKLTMLQRKMKLQNDAVKQYEGALAEADRRLQESISRQNDYANRLVVAKAKQAQLKTEVANAAKAYKHYKNTLGETDSVTIAAKGNLDLIKEDYRQQTAEVHKLAGQNVALTKSTQNAADAFTSANVKLKTAKAEYKETAAAVQECKKELAASKSSWTAAGKSMEEFSKKCENASTALSKAGKSLSLIATTPILALGKNAIKASIDYETAFTSVKKTVNATDTEYVQLSNDIKQMSTEIATSASDIAEVMAIAGQLGIQNDYLSEFTRIMIDLGNSTDIVAEDAASTLAKFANIMGMNQSQFSNLGSTLVELGNNFATTESGIMEMSQRLAGAGKQVGLTESQILGFATALSSVGIEAEAGGSAFSKALVKMEVAAATGGEALEDFAAISGMTADEFKTIWDNDPASAFQAFISGLAQMDEEGMSTIAVLDEIGITEIRLRDTLLRATNATELFANAQAMATSAWEDNVALATEANLRYGTTESKLKNLKNTATLFAQTLGDDLNPTIQKLIDGASEILEKIMALDESERAVIIKNAAIAASIGPVLLVASKVTKVIGNVSGAIGKFATAVGKAGGGFKGFMSVVGSSPMTWIALTAAVTAGALALYDYVSGAKAVREALDGMEETANTWKNTAAETFYGQSSGLSFFEMTAEDFKRETVATEDWVSGVISIWEDGKNETDEIVSQWTESFKNMTASTRSELQELKDSADASGYTGVSAQIQSDIDALNSMDDEITNLLKRRQNGYLSDSEKIRLQELIDTRDAIEIKYNLTSADADGFDTVISKVQAEVNRAMVQGKTDADVSVYENAVVALGEGMATVNEQLDEEYDKEYAILQLIEDENERKNAEEALNSKYTSDRLTAAQEYAQALAQVTKPVLQQADIQQASEQMGTLLEKLREYSITGNTDEGILSELQKLASEMDEGALTEYISLLTQMQSLLDSGMEEDKISNLFGIDFSKELDNFAGIADYLGDVKEGLPGLYSMLNESLPDEVLTIATDLDMTGAQARWDDFAANPGAITTTATAYISEYKESWGASLTVPKPQTQVGISGYDLIAYSNFIKNNPVTVQGIVRVGDKYDNMDDVLGADNVKFFNENGVEIPATLVPAELLTPSNVAVLDEDGTMHILITPEIVGTVEAVKEAGELLKSTEHQGSIGAWLLGDTTLDDIKRLNEYLMGVDSELNSWLNIFGWMDSWDTSAAADTLSAYLDEEEIGAIQSYVAEAMAAINNGEILDEEILANLKSILELVQLMDSIGIGENILATMWQGMEEAGEEESAETVAENIENSLNEALDIESPSKRVKPVGEYVAEGVGVGMSEYDFSEYASTMASAIETSLKSALATVGTNAMYGLRDGISAGTASVVSAMRLAAQNAVYAAKSELKIESPSKVFRDEIGAMTMRGFGEGIIQESKEQARIIQNATRYLTGEAKSGSITTMNTDNRKTYNTSNTVSFEGASFYVNDAQDAYSLAVEIAALTKRQQRGKGLRMA